MLLPSISIAVGVDVGDLARLLSARRTIPEYFGELVFETGADDRRLGRRGAAPPAAACSNPSGPGWRRRARGTESGRPRSRPSAPGRRRCTGPLSFHPVHVVPASGRGRGPGRSCPFSTTVSAGATITFDSSSARSHSTFVANLAVDRPSGTAVIEEAVVIDLGVDAEARDEADVRPFGRLDRADAAVVRDVHVADFEARPLPSSEPPGPRADRRARG